MSTRDVILKHLKSGGTLTKISAIAPPFSTTNLGDKILVLRKQGWPIEKRWEESSTGKRYAVYYLEAVDSKAA